MQKKKKDISALLRFVAGLALFAGAAILPWPITLMAAFFLAFKFKKYWEMPLAGLFIDILFYYPGFKVFEIFDTRIATFLIFLIIFLLIEGAKKYLKV